MERSLARSLGPGLSLAPTPGKVDLFSLHQRSANSRSRLFLAIIPSPVWVTGAAGERWGGARSLFGAAPG
jgi:hypothetical protein